MSDTPETDAVRDDMSQNILEHARRMERERDEARERVKDLIHENKNLYRRLESVHERDLEELITAAKAVIDRWETPFWKEAAHTGAYIAALRKAVEIADGGHL